MQNNKDCCEHFLIRGNHYFSLIENITTKYSEGFSDYIDQCRRLKDVLYCKNSNLAMGVFCPCPVHDIVVGNTKRGVLCKNKPRNKNTHIYYFQNDRIKMIEHGLHFFFFYYDENNKNVTIYKYTQTDVDKVSINLYECVYDDFGRIKKYIEFRATELTFQNLLIKMFNCKPITINFDKYHSDYTFDITEKHYFYSDDMISEMKQINFSSLRQSVSSRSYKFSYKNGIYAECITGTFKDKHLKKRKYYEYLTQPLYSKISTQQ